MEQSNQTLKNQLIQSEILKLLTRETISEARSISLPFATGTTSGVTREGP